MNWGLLGLGISAALLLGWIALAFGRRWSVIGLCVSLACLLMAAINSVAPIRGAVDPAYPGYAFGYIQASSGLPVTLAAGSIFLGALIASFVALNWRAGPPLWIVFLFCVVMTALAGGPWITAALGDIAGNTIQFGEYLTIPGWLGTILLFVLQVLPFAVGASWALGQALRRTA